MGVYSASGGVQMIWNDWSNCSLEGPFKLVASGKDRWYISSLGTVAKLIGDEATKIVINLQNTLKSLDGCFQRAQEHLLEKKQAVRSAHSIFDAEVANVEEKKRDLQNKRKQLKNDQ
ncbi:hypothetical protein DPMN_060110 [Dreissena polymorpha]|uniref:Uncharacterized protein n=1 Tax=Dreissena polymorpha TaxID=45954 RepID=A0A9D4C4M5_DREPO|nr:hypothetical protein DPMN_060110 [Dreissena polymorpha]